MGSCILSWREVQRATDCFAIIGCFVMAKSLKQVWLSAIMKQPATCVVGCSKAERTRFTHIRFVHLGALPRGRCQSRPQRSLREQSFFLAGTHQQASLPCAPTRKNGCDYRHNRCGLDWRRGQDSPLIIRALTPFDYQLVTFLEIAKKRNFRLPSVPILSEYTMLLMR